MSEQRINMGMSGREMQDEKDAASDREILEKNKQIEELKKSNLESQKIREAQAVRIAEMEQLMKVTANARKNEEVGKIPNRDKTSPANPQDSEMDYAKYVTDVLEVKNTDSAPKSSDPQKNMEGDANKIASDFEADYGKPSSANPASAPETTPKPTSKVLNDEDQAAANVKNLEERFGQAEEASKAETKSKTIEESTAKPEDWQTMVDKMEKGGVSSSSASETEPQKPELSGDKTTEELMKELKDSEANLKNKKQAYLEAVSAYQNRKKSGESADILNLNLQMAREDYKKALHEYATKSIEVKKAWLAKEGTGDLDKELESHKKALYEKLVFGEYDALAKYDQEEFTPKEKGLFRKAMEKISKIKRWKAIAAGVAIGTGIFAAGGASIGMIATYAAWRTIKAASSALVGEGVLKGGLSITEKVAKNYTKKGEEQLSKNNSKRITENLENRQQFWNFLQKEKNKYGRVLDETSRRRNIGRFLTGVAAAGAGVGTYSLMSQYDSLINSWNFGHQTPEGHPSSHTEAPTKSGATGNFEQSGADGQTPEGHPSSHTETPPNETAENIGQQTPEGHPSSHTEASSPAEPIIEISPDSNPLENISNWVSGKYGTIGFDELKGYTIGDVLDPNFVDGHPEVGGPGWNELQDRIVLRNDIIHEMGLREADLTENFLSSRTSRAPLLEVLDQMSKK